MEKKVNLIRMSHSGNPGILRKLGVSRSTAKYVAFLDSDDYWTEDKLQICSKYFLPDVDLIYHDLKIFDESLKLQDNKKIKSRQLKTPVTIELLLKGNTIATSSAVVRKTVIDSVGGMNEAPEFIGTEDYNTWLKISQKTEGFKHIGRELGYYRLHEANISNMKAYTPPRAAIAEFVVKLSNKERQKLESSFLYTSARLTYLSGDHSEAKITLKKLIRTKHFRYVLKALWMLSAAYLFSMVHNFRKIKTLIFEQ
jgi:glycosyltransferase involved in cell wall biosynthesis